MKFLRDAWESKSSALWLALMRIAIGYIFIESGYGKLTTPGGFASHMGGTLTSFASKNPYPWMVNLLHTVAIPNAAFFGVLIPWGELLAGLSLFFGVLSPIGLLGALALNLTFYFAAGWTGASTATANEVMAIAEVIMLFGMAGRVLSVDQLLGGLYARVLPWKRQAAMKGNLTPKRAPTA